MGTQVAGAVWAGIGVLRAVDAMSETADKATTANETPRRRWPGMPGREIA